MYSRFDIIPGVRKIAVVRANGIGDLIFALPALDGLRRAYPQAEIVLLACDWHRAFLAGRPSAVDRVLPIPPSRGVREDTGRPEDPAELAHFFERMCAERFDLAVQMHGGGRYSNPFVRRLGARTTAGLRTPDAEPLDRWLPYVYFQPEIVRYIEVASLVGARAETLDPSIEVTPRDLDESLAVVPDRMTPFAVLHPSASDPRRRWPPEKFGRIGRSFRDAGLDVFVVGVEHDRALARRVLDVMGAPGFDLTGRLSLNGLAGLLSRAAVVVSNDSGPLHLAAAVGARTVGLYWCGNVITAAPVTRARHRPVMSWRLECPRCGAHAIDEPCDHGDSFVAEIPVEEVMRAAFDMLEEEEEEVEEERPRAAS